MNFSLFIRSLFLGIFLCATHTLAAQSAEEFYKRASYHQDRGELDDALDFYTATIQLDYYHQSARFNRALIYFQQEKYRKSIYDFTAILDKNPSDIEVLELRANAHLMIRNFAAAAIDFTKAIDNAPEQALMYINRGRAYLQLGREWEAEQDFKKVISIDEDNIEAQLLLAHIYSEDGDYAGALRYYNQVIKMDETNIEALNNRSNLYFVLDYQDIALRGFSEAIKITPNSASFLNRGLVYLAQENFELAMGDCMKSYTFNEENAEACFCMGMVFYETKSYTEALTYFNRAIELGDGSVAIQNLKKQAEQLVDQENLMSMGK